MTKAKTVALSCLTVLLCAACGARPMMPSPGPGPRSDDAETRAIQLYLVLTDRAHAMETQAEIDDMWSAIKDLDSPYAHLRGDLGRIPPDFALNVEFDFAALPHRSLNADSMGRMISKLGPESQALAQKAKLGIFIRVESDVLPQGQQIRLGGLSALFAAERNDGIILDLLSRRAYTIEQWRSALSRSPLWPSQVRLIRRPLSGGLYALETRGHPKFGLPDLQIMGVTSQKLNAAMERLGAARTVLWSKGRAPFEGRTRLRKTWAISDCQKGSYDVSCVALEKPQ